MREAFTIGQLPASYEPISIWHADELETVRCGQVIAPLNDYLLVWDEHCLPPSKLEPWRRESDDLADDVVRVLGLRAGQDGLERILHHLAQPEHDRSEVVQRFWIEVSTPPPEGIAAASHIFDPRQTLLSPNRRPPATLSEGQAVFWRHSLQIFSALLHFSLAGGFSANRVMNVLTETAYLTGDARDRTYKRLLETTQAIMDYMNDMTPVTGIGWKSAIRVRLLHATVRIRILGGKGMTGKYDVAADGVPINQEDLVATLGAFAIAPIWSLRRMGCALNPEEEEAFVAAWRHIGYYLGIKPDRLRHHYADLARAEKLFASNTMHLFSSNIVSTDYRTTHTYRLLSAVCNRPPRYTPVDQSMAMSRFLLGDGLADRLALPPLKTSHKIRMQLNFALERLLTWFGGWYRHGWEVERVAMTRMLMLMIVCWQLGVKRTKFTIKAFDEVVTLGEKSDTDDDELDPEVTMGPEAGRRVIRRWRWLLGEMAGVLVGISGIGAGAAYLLYKS